LMLHISKLSGVHPCKFTRNSVQKPCLCYSALATTSLCESFRSTSFQKEVSEPFEPL